MKIIISHIFNHFMAGRAWKGLDVRKIVAELEVNQFQVETIPFSQLVNHDLSNTILFYSSIYNADYLKYIRDTVQHLKQKHPSLVIAPSIEMLNSLNNKGYQEYLKQELKIDSLAAKYYGDFFDFYQDENPLPFPFVWKTNDGALSTGVKLVNSIEELKELEKECNKRSIKGKLAQQLNKRNCFKKDVNLKGEEELFDTNFEDFFALRTPFVTQKFIPKLTHDWKILTFANRIFFMKRNTRENDFRASGSGDYYWIDPLNEPLLKHVGVLIEKFNHPFLSLDIAEDEDGNFYLFELQGTAFGPIAMVKSDFYYEKTGDTFVKKQNEHNLEQHYAHSLMALAEKHT